MLKIDKYIYTCHRKIVSSTHDKNVYSAPHTIHINKWQYKFREK